MGKINPRQGSLPKNVYVPDDSGEQVYANTPAHPSMRIPVPEHAPDAAGFRSKETLQPQYDKALQGAGPVNIHPSMKHREPRDYKTIGHDVLDDATLDGKDVGGIDPTASPGARPAPAPWLRPGEVPAQSFTDQFSPAVMASNLPEDE